MDGRAAGWLVGSLVGWLPNPLDRSANVKKDRRVAICRER